MLLRILMGGGFALMLVTMGARASAQPRDTHAWCWAGHTPRDGWSSDEWIFSEVFESTDLNLRDRWSELLNRSLSRDGRAPVWAREPECRSQPSLERATIEREQIMSEARAYGTVVEVQMTPAAPALQGAALPGTAQPASLQIPANPEFLISDGPALRNATTIVNGTVIDRSEVDQRVAFISIRNNGQVAADDRPLLRQQVLRTLIDEVLKIQEAQAAGRSVTQSEVDQHFARFASPFASSPEGFATFLRSAGASAETVKHQIRAELAWMRLLRDPSQSATNAGEAEARAISARLNSAGGIADPSDAVLSLAQLTLPLPRGGTRMQLNTMAQTLQRTARAGGCGGADAASGSIGAEVIKGDDVRVVNLSGTLRQALLALNPGEATQPFISPGGGASILILCGRDDGGPGGDVNLDDGRSQLVRERANRRARRHLQDLRRDAVIDHR